LKLFISPYPQIVQTPKRQILKSSNRQILKSSNRQNSKSPNRQNVKTPKRQILKSLKRQIVKTISFCVKPKMLHRPFQAFFEVNYLIIPKNRYLLPLFEQESSN